MFTPDSIWWDPRHLWCEGLFSLKCVLRVHRIVKKCSLLNGISSLILVEGFPITSFKLPVARANNDQRSCTYGTVLHKKERRYNQRAQVTKAPWEFTRARFNLREARFCPIFCTYLLRGGVVQSKLAIKLAMRRLCIQESVLKTVHFPTRIASFRSLIHPWVSDELLLALNSGVCNFWTPYTSFTKSGDCCYVLTLAFTKIRRLLVGTIQNCVTAGTCSGLFLPNWLTVDALQIPNQPYFTSKRVFLQGQPSCNI